MTLQFGELMRAENIRDFWPTEDRHFTPWLADESNIRRLGEALGVELEVESTEQSVGPFSADIVCVDPSDGSRVIIENQFGRSNHDHLGKMLTYAAGLDETRAVVWIVERFTEEHRAALDWLNHVAGDAARFFGVEIEVWRIGDSAPAPRFTVISKPNEWVNATRVRSTGELTDLQQLRLDYWTAFRDFLERSRSPIRIQKPRPDSYVHAAAGRAGTHLSANVVTWDEETNATVPGLNRAELVLQGKNAKLFFAQLESQREAIEAAFGEPLRWRNPDDAMNCKVYVKRMVNFPNRDEWPEQFAWLQSRMELLRTVFTPYVEALDATWVPDDEAPPVPLT